jgi:hypothetical protein
MLRRGESSTETWSIPLCERTLGVASDERCGIVAQKEATLLRGPCNGAPLLLNAGGSGYFVVDYSAEERAAILANLGKVTPEEEIALHGDEWLLVRYLRADVGDYLTLANALPRPAPLEIVESFASNLQFLDERLVTDADRAQWQAAVRALMRDQAPASWRVLGKESDEARAQRAEVGDHELGHVGQGDRHHRTGVVLGGSGMARPQCRRDGVDLRVQLRPGQHLVLPTQCRSFATGLPGGAADCVSEVGYVLHVG